jgi:5-methylcytosine-specific restriction endonuclease McrA
MLLDDLNIHDVGGSIQIVGAVYQGEGKTYLCLFPGELNDLPVEELEMDLEDWQRFLRQTDLRETRVLAEAGDEKTTKIVMRKSSRQISQRVSWAVYERDDYRCRYCGLRAPLTVDHLVLWEEGGPSIEANLAAACKKCNRTRGNTQYADWLKSAYYKKVSKGLMPNDLALNRAVLDTLATIPRMVHKHGKR